MIYYTDSRYKVYKDKLQNCSCNQLHCVDICSQVETNNMTNNRGGNKGSEKLIIIKKHCGYCWANWSSTRFLCLHGMCTVIGLAKKCKSEEGGKWL